MSNLVRQKHLKRSVNTVVIDRNKFDSAKGNIVGFAKRKILEYFQELLGRHYVY